MNNRHIFLSVTERCNLNCIYCFEKSKRPESMSIETALEYIYEELNSPYSEKVLIDFMGGEPFLEFELIKTICETVWSHEWAKEYLFYCATNGTLVHGEIRDWLYQHRDSFVCALSLDGTRESHNINRSNSFDEIDIDFFRMAWPNERTKTLCSKETLNNLAESIKYIYSLGFPDIDLKLAYSFDWSNLNEMRQLQEQFDNLIDYFAENSHLKPPSLLNLDLNELNYIGKPIKSWCTLGGSTVSVDMYGKRFPCRYFQDLVREDKIQYEDLWNVDYANIEKTLKGKCVNCLIRDICRTCYAYNLDICGDFGIKNNYSCELHRICAYSTAKLTLRKLDNINQINDIDIALLANAKAVISAHDNNNWYI